MPSLSPLPRGYPAVRAHLGALPASPGVYLFRDASGQVLYVGKSVCLRARVRSYFGESAGRYRKLRRLRCRVKAVEWIETGSELEALLLESRLVKERHPPFNTLLQRHRHLVFLRLDLGDPFPRLEVTEQLRRDGARYFGPFTLTADAERLAGILADTLRLRTCDPPGARVHQIPPCLRRDLGLCLAPCAPARDVAAYAEAVRGVALAFERKGWPFRERLRAEMLDAAERLLFERAARLRDALRSLEELAGRQQALLSAIDSLDLIAACPSARAGHLELFLFEHGRFLGQRSVPRESLRKAEDALNTSRDLLRLWETLRSPGPEPAAGTTARRSAAAASSELEPELLDELFILSRWLRRHSGAGRHFLLPPDEESSILALRLGAWLRDVALEGIETEISAEEVAVEESEALAPWAG